MASLEFGNKVEFMEKAKTEKSNVEVDVVMNGFVRGIKIEPTADGTRKKYLISDRYPAAYCTPSDYGWFGEDVLTKI